MKDLTRITPAETTPAATPLILHTGPLGPAYMVVQVQTDCGMTSEAGISRCFPCQPNDASDPRVILELSIRDDAFRNVGTTNHGATFEMRASTLDRLAAAITTATSAARTAGLIPAEVRDA